jgi:uncharacterized protein YbjT (DUF2867 family)
MYVVLGASGNVGKVVAETLLADKKQVRLFVRDPGKVAALVERGAEAIKGEIEDVAGLTAALRGAEGAFFLIPPPAFTATGVLASRAKIVDAMTAAAKASRLGHVVFLSSVGAQHAHGTGVIETLHHGETHLGAPGIGLTIVRAAYFMENWLGMLQPVTKDGVLPAFFAPAKKIPMVASRDIGVTVARALVGGPFGKRVFELGGPEDYDTYDVAAAFGKLLHKEVNVFPLPREAQVGALQQAGFGQEMAELFVGLDAGIDSGAVDWEPHGTTRVRGEVGLEAFLAGVLGAQK